MYQHLLVPVEDTDAGIEAIGHATEFAQAVGARITFLHVSSASCGVSGATPGNADEHADALLARAEAGARAQGVPCTCVAAAGAGTLGTLLAQARRHDCDLICTGASLPDGHAASAEVILPAMLSCGTDRRPAVAASIGALLSAHRTLADMLHEWLDTIRAAHDRSAAPSAATTRDIARRLQDLPARGFRAKEKVALFRRLRKRTSRLNAELAELERLHRRDDELVHELTRVVGREPDCADAPEDIERAVSAYARFVWEWMGREQGVILPAARRYLSYADWTEIDGTFSPAERATNIE